MNKPEIRKCVFPDCNNPGMSLGLRGENSPVLKAGGDKSKRASFCRFHQKGKGKPERLAWQGKAIPQ